MTMTWKQHVVVLSPSGGLWMRQHKRGGCLMMMWALQHYISIALYHPGSSDGLFALCLCLSVCFCVLAVTTQVQMLRASLSEASGRWLTEDDRWWWLWWYYLWVTGDDEVMMIVLIFFCGWVMMTGGCDCVDIMCGWLMTTGVMIVLTLFVGDWWWWGDDDCVDFFCGWVMMTGGSDCVDIMCGWLMMTGVMIVLILFVGDWWWWGDDDCVDTFLWLSDDDRGLWLCWHYVWLTDDDRGDDCDVINCG